MKRISDTEAIHDNGLLTTALQGVERSDVLWPDFGGGGAVSGLEECLAGRGLTVGRSGSRQACFSSSIISARWLSRR